MGLRITWCRTRGYYAKSTGARANEIIPMNHISSLKIESNGNRNRSGPIPILIWWWMICWEKTDGKGKETSKNLTKKTPDTYLAIASVPCTVFVYICLRQNSTLKKNGTKIIPNFTLSFKVVQKKLPKKLRPLQGTLGLNPNFLRLTSIFFLNI